MKYLKRFEALERDEFSGFTKITLDEIKEYCEINLAYLLDMGMVIECSDIIDDKSSTHECQVSLSFDDIPTSTILDHVIPFLKRVENCYQLGTWLAHNANFLFNCGGSQYFLSSEELNDIENLIASNPSTQRNIKAGFDTQIEEIYFYIIDEK